MKDVTCGVLIIGLRPEVVIVLKFGFIDALNRIKRVEVVHYHVGPVFHVEVIWHTELQTGCSNAYL